MNRPTQKYVRFRSTSYTMFFGYVLHTYERRRPDFLNFLYISRYFDLFSLLSQDSLHFIIKLSVSKFRQELSKEKKKKQWSTRAASAPKNSPLKCLRRRALFSAVTPRAVNAGASRTPPAVTTTASSRTTTSGFSRRTQASGYAASATRKNGNHQQFSNCRTSDQLIA